MRLTTFSDHAVRTLLYLALQPDRFVPISEIADACRMSRNHLVKVVQHLAATGDVTTLRGPHGGARLARPPCDIRLGTVLRNSEPMPAPDPQDPWGQVAAKALTAFIAVLDDHSLADLAANSLRPDQHPGGHDPDTITIAPPL